MCRHDGENLKNGIVRMPLIMSSFLQRKTRRRASVFYLKSSVWSLSPYFLVGPVQKTNNSKKSPYFLSPDFFSPFLLILCLFGISHFLSSVKLGRLEILHPIGRVGGLCRSPSPAPQVAEGTWVLNGALCTVFLRGGPLSPALICHRSLSVHAPQCLIVSAKSPGSRPDLNNAFLPNTDPGFRFSSTHKGILSYCPRLEGDLDSCPPPALYLLSAFES